MALLLADHVLDNGLGVLDTEADRVDICSAVPDTYTEATSTYSCGYKDISRGSVFGSPADADPDGRYVTMAAISGGEVTATDDVICVAISDSTNSRLLATLDLDTTYSVTDGNYFNLGTADIGINVTEPVVDLGEDWEDTAWKDSWINFQRSTDNTDYSANFSRKTDIYHGGVAGCSSTNTGQRVFPKRGTLSAIPQTISLRVYLDVTDFGNVGLWFGSERDGDNDLVNGAVVWGRCDNNELYVQHLDADGALTGGNSTNGATKSADTWYEIRMTFADQGGGTMRVTSGWYSDGGTLIDSVYHDFTTATDFPSLDYGIVVYNTTSESIRIDDLVVTE